MPPNTLSPAFERANKFLTITGKVSSDKFKLFLDCIRSDPSLEHQITREEILSLVEEATQKNLINLAVIDDIVATLNAGQAVSERRVSKGIPAQDGKDGKLLFMVKRYLVDGRQQDREYLDLRNLHTFDNIEPGTVLARIYPHRQGTPGIDVLGNAIPAKNGREARVVFDSSITRIESEPGKPFATLVANGAGYLADDKGKLTIKDLLAIKGNVDFHTGSIDFIGAVTISGDVQRNFRVHARNDIEVLGNVQAGFLNSDTGAVSVKGTIFGVGHQNYVQAPEHVDSRMLNELVLEHGIQVHSFHGVKALCVQNAIIETGGNVEVTKEIVNSTVRSKMAVLLPQGHLIGGTTYSVCGVEAKTLGSPRETPTLIQLCSDIESTSEFADLQLTLAKYQEAEALLEMQLGPYATVPQSISRLKDTLRERMTKLFQKLRFIQAAKAKLEAQRALLLGAAETNSVLRVVYHQQLHRGVEIRVGSVSFAPEQPLQGPGSVEFNSADQTFRVCELKPLQCTVDVKTKPKK